MSNLTPSVPPTRKYNGKTILDVCLEPDPERRVAGFDEAGAFFPCLYLSFHLKSSETQFRFVTGTTGVLGKLALAILHVNGTVLLFNADGVREDIHVLLGLDVMMQYGLILYFDKDGLHCEGPKWVMRMTYQLGHAFVDLLIKGPGMNQAGSKMSHTNLASWTHFHFRLYVHFTDAKLTKMYFQFYHPSGKKLSAIPGRVHPHRSTTSVRKLLDGFNRADIAGAELSTRHLIFPASFPRDEIFFHHEVAIHIVWLGGLPVLDQVDIHIRCQEAAVLRSKSAEDGWSQLMECCGTRF